MQYVAAYALLHLGGNKQPSRQIIQYIGISEIKGLLSEIGVDGSEEAIEFLIYSLKGKELKSVIEEGLLLLESYSSNMGKLNFINLGLIEKQSEEKRNNFHLFKKQEEERLKQQEVERKKEQEILKQKQIQLEEQKKREEEERQIQILLQKQREIEQKQREQEEIQRQLELKKKEEEEERQKQIQLQKQREQEEIQRQLELKKKEEEEERYKQIQLQKQKEQEEIQRQLELNKKQEEERLKEIQKVEQEKMQQHLEELKEKERQILEAQKKLTEELQQKKGLEKIAILEKEVQAVLTNPQATQTFQTYQIAKCEQQKLQILKESNQVRKPTPIYHMNQQITANNQEVLFHVISENLMRDQKRELLITPQSQKIGLTSALFAESENQKCLKFRTTQANFEEINNNQQKKADFLLDFKQKVSQNLKVPIDEIEILDIVQGSVQVLFTLKKKEELNQNELQALQNVCGGTMEVYNYFAGSQNNLVGLSAEDFTPQYNMQWAPAFQEKEQRGPKHHRYDYYFPRGYYGYALNVLNKYGPDNSWLLMDGNDKEWRILYHGTKHAYMQAIVSQGLTPGNGQAHQSDTCAFTNKIVGRGVYFSDTIQVCETSYTSPTTIGNKQFRLVFQSRVNPLAVRQSTQMKKQNYFVVNSSSDIRPYRILLKEV